MYNSIKISGRDLLLYVDILDILSVDYFFGDEYRQNIMSYSSFGEESFSKQIIYCQHTMTKTAFSVV